MYLPPNVMYHMRHYMGLYRLDVNFTGWSCPAKRDTSPFGPTEEVSHGGKQGGDPPEYREQIVEFVRTNRSPGSLEREFEPSEQSIRNWVNQGNLEEEHRSDGLTTEARIELLRLKREKKRLRMEREFQKRAAAWIARESDSISSGGRRS